MPVRTYRLVAVAAGLALSSLTACTINNPAPAPPVVVQPQTPPSVVVQPPPAPLVVQPSY